MKVGVFGKYFKQVLIVQFLNLVYRYIYISINYCETTYFKYKKKF